MTTPSAQAHHQSSPASSHHKRRRLIKGVFAWVRELGTARTALAALLVTAVTSLVAGIILASAREVLKEFNGLLILVPAAIAVNGNIFGALGSRLSTAIHAGTFKFSGGRESVVVQNTLAAVVLSFGLGVVLAVLAKAVALAFSVSPTMSMADFVVVSTLCGLMSAGFVLVIALTATAGAVRFGWDLDNVVAPLVTATADVVTLPALVVSALLVKHNVTVTTVLAWVLPALALVCMIWALSNELLDVRRIARESLPVLVAAGLLDLVAGVTVERRLEDFLEQPLLLVLFPGYLATAGALGGILSSRLATKLHLGLVKPIAIPRGPARSDMGIIFVLSTVVFAALGSMTSGIGLITDFNGPGFGSLIGISLIGGLSVTVFIAVVAYYSTLVAVRIGFDPDTYGIPVVTSLLDFVGALTLIVVIVTLGVV